jgi:dCMP deaminase
MDRPQWDDLFIDMCCLISKRSTCARIQTAAILARDNVVISIGYNGVVSGKQHCKVVWSGAIKDSNEFYEAHHKWSRENELHGEMNCLLQAAKNGIMVDGSTLYTLYSPCIDCSKCIVASGVKRVVYKNLYNRDKSGLILLEQSGILVQQV